jgi:hypothetical protein
MYIPTWAVETVVVVVVTVDNIEITLKFDLFIIIVFNINF